MIAAAEQSTSIHGITFGDFVAKRSTATESEPGLTDALSLMPLVVELDLNQRCRIEIANIFDSITKHRPNCPTNRFTDLR